MVVDDNLDAAQTFAMLLKALGHVAHFVTDPFEAIEVARLIHPDVAFLDIGLPRMNGYDLAKMLKIEFPDICLVAVTGYGLPEYKKRGIEAGFHSYLPKPPDIAAVERILADLFGQGA